MYLLNGSCTGIVDVDVGQAVVNNFEVTQETFVFTTVTHRKERRHSVVYYYSTAMIWHYVYQFSGAVPAIVSFGPRKPPGPVLQK